MTFLQKYVIKTNIMSDIIKVDDPDLKEVMSEEDMKNFFLKWYPFISPTKNAVGRLSVRLGYKCVNQRKNGIKTRFYITIKMFNELY